MRPLKILMALITMALVRSACADINITSIPEPARVGCNAAYSTACSRRNSEYLARNLTASVRRPNPLFFDEINRQEHNMNVGFYPFVIRKSDAVCVAHGADAGLVGSSLQTIFISRGLGFANATSLHKRFVAAANSGGDWSSYLWSDGGKTNSKLAFVVSLDDEHLLGVGYENVQLPPNLPCSAEFDSWCSITNVRSLVGKAQFHLEQADSMASFEAAMFDLSFSEEFQIAGGFYVFMYDFSGRLKAHGRLHNSFGDHLGDIIADNNLSTYQEGLAIHEQFVAAAQDNGWIQYKWRDSLDSEPYTKISLLTKVEFDGVRYYAGVGFNFQQKEFPDGPLGKPCSPGSSLPCAFESTLRLSSHVLSHAVSSSDSPTSIFDEIANSFEFKSLDSAFYVFIYDYNGTCVSHGAVPTYAGNTLSGIFQLNGIDQDGRILHQQFRTAADNGGGWVSYDWLVPGVEDSEFLKMSYIFRINLDGRDYYGGIGLNNIRGPTELYAERGATKGGDRIRCSSQYGWECSEVNARALLGQALADLTLASLNPANIDGDSVTKYSELYNALEEVALSPESYGVNDFTVMVFSYDSTICNDDSTGCCIADGNGNRHYGKTWQEIIDEEGITSISGSVLHRKLRDRANLGEGFSDYHWSGLSGFAEKRAWASRFQSGGVDFYILADYLKTTPPSTCDSCPSGTECTSEDQEFCVEKPPLPLIKRPFVISLIVISLVGMALIGGMCQWKKRQSKLRSLLLIQEHQRKIDEMADQLEKQMQGMVKVVHDMPIHSADEYMQRIGVRDPKEGLRDNRGTAVWFWEETEGNMHHHDSAVVLHGTNFVQYGRDVSDMIETAFRQYKEGHGFRTLHLDLTDKITKAVSNDTGCHYDVDFDLTTQTNTKSKYVRQIHREENARIDDSIIGNLPPLPSDIDFRREDGENLLPCSVGQVIQVTKKKSGFLYGSVLFDPVLHEAQLQQQSEAPGSSAVNSALARAIHSRPTSGWFPEEVSETADISVMHTLLDNLGGSGADVLTPPTDWAKDKYGEYIEGRVPVPEGSTEYQTVARHFQSSLYDVKAKVVGIERIQNVPLWQTYAMKHQTVVNRTNKPDYERINNRDRNDIERRWLFHGTTLEIIPKIEKQGFNRAFAGRNAVFYGKGVYFARDSKYSSHPTYSAKDSEGVQRMFLSRVVIGDYCRGNDGQLTPDPIPGNDLVLFDSTVDNVNNPSLFVVYHDAQAYPEYLVSFKN